jgi:hypothetical protein
MAGEPSLSAGKGAQNPLGRLVSDVFIIAVEAAQQRSKNGLNMREEIPDFTDQPLLP